MIWIKRWILSLGWRFGRDLEEGLTRNITIWLLDGIGGEVHLHGLETALDTKDPAQ